ncbi:MAG TPA: choice-of-anchor B family protein [Saprospiraceae bacterium]|nr:choice-of-anchor B family protein [Saprospiraceae bacterium]
MKKILLWCGILFLMQNLWAQKNPDLNMKIIAHVPGLGSGCWHFVDKNGIEYAVIGTTSSLDIYSLEDPTKPILRKTVPGVNTIWREVFAYKNHIYAVTDQNSDGLIIVDMTNAPMDIKSKFWTTTVTAGGQTEQITTCHTNFVDEKGILTLHGCRPWQGVLFFDVNQDPNNPKFLGSETVRYCHDMFMRGDTMFTSDIYEGLCTIYDVKDKTNVKELASIKTPFSFNHNSWRSDDGKYIFTTDEVEEAPVTSYDISDLNNIKLLDKYKPADTDGLGVIGHNVRYLDGYIITSYYTDGVKICDAHKPDNIVEVGAVDTYPGGDGGFFGCWGVSPYLPSKTIIASDMQGGLFIIKPTYVRAAYFEGLVLDSLTNDPIQDAKVVIKESRINKKFSNAKGEFKTGYHEPGVFQVEFSHPDYITRTIDVQFTRGVVNLQNVKLLKKQTESFVVEVVDEATGEVLPNAKIVMFNNNRKSTATTNLQGSATMQIFNEGIDYTVVAGKWGYKESELKVNLNSSVRKIKIAVSKGYKDDFILDQGWTVSGTASTGLWVKAKPLGTQNDDGSLSQTDLDLINDIGDECYVTGNSSTDVAADDVDNGYTILKSPSMDLTNYSTAQLNYSTWFTNGGGRSTPNDKMEIWITNGTDSLLLETINKSIPSWNSSNIVLTNKIKFTDKMTLYVYIADNDPGHLVEGGFDGFLVTGNTIIGTNDKAIDDIKLIAQPSVFKDETTIEYNLDSRKDAVLSIINLEGKIISSTRLFQSSGNIKIGREFPVGLYQIILTSEKESKAIKVSKQ